jgi:hypothetical protein
MNNFDFLDSLGESKNNFREVNIGKDKNEIVVLLDTLIARQLMSEDFKNELLDLYLNNKIDRNKLEQNIEKSIKTYQSVELQVLSVDETAFKHKDDTLEYVGTIPKMPGQKDIINPNSGKVSYNFANVLCQRLKYRNIKLGEIIALSDCLDFKVWRIFDFKQLSN